MIPSTSTLVKTGLGDVVRLDPTARPVSALHHTIQWSTSIDQLVGRHDPLALV